MGGFNLAWGLELIASGKSVAGDAESGVLVSYYCQTRLALSDAPRIRCFLEQLVAHLDRNVRVVGAGPGCSRLDILIESNDLEECYLIARRLLEDRALREMALREGGFVRLILRKPFYEGLDLRSGRRDGYAAKEVVIGDKYVVKQAANVGPGGHAHDFAQIWQELRSQQGDVDFEALACELDRLRAEMKARAGTAEEDEAIGAVAAAEKAAKAADGPRVLSALRSAGKWALTTATAIGATLTADIIKRATMSG